MEKNLVILLFMSLIVMSTCDKTFHSSSCGPLPENYAMIGESFSKEGGKPIEITYRVGHNANTCNNSCILVNGIPSHEDCQGYGDACVVKIRLWPIGGQPKGGTFSMMVDTLWEPTSGDFFNMPARSLIVLDSPDAISRFLNIPSQLLERDSHTQQFIFNGLFFSDTAAYNND